ncbi:hypothetical protein COU17_02340 [Candidatus Kaiserbacteria bacterium CG10_big_fil_rev_8_21_14_0_10_49_17]|uniref:Uncharacterized protein n=1 Tax=Candidatus Kaiserbacteria bacterium CG10_big_fil_rev_8_21_14_0_10_49_17 TaxID=1974609 RepID=A0A2M6WEA0_9BACT|nr:MAG: hypothetical protein COU17_02340 [Candidatus Kaiserbacteria bacterium CG10_big_fil_rev_8_21_14_0_10_49_17]
MKELVEVINESVTPTHCSVHIGGTTLFFQMTPRGAWKTDKIGNWVSDNDFKEAKRQAECAMRSKKEEARFPHRPDTFAVSEEACTLALSWGRTFLHEPLPHYAITEWLIATGRWSKAREQEMRSLVAKRGARKADMTRKRKKALKEKSRREPTFF